MDLGLGGKAALVTGGSRGIGRATAHALAREGARVAVCARGEADLARVKAELEALGAKAHFVVADVATSSGAEAAVKSVLGAFGAIDLLPWGRFGAPEEVAEDITLLLSPKASWVTGSCVVVDGAQGRAF